MLGWFARADSINSESFHQQAKDGGWSIQQVLLHLLQVQQATLDMLKNSTKKTEKHKKADMKNRLTFIGLKVALMSNFKFKAPKMISKVDNQVTLHQIKKEWKGVQESFYQFLNEFPEQFQNKLILKHPVAGWLTLNQAIDFLLDHLKHHRRQIELLYSQVE